MKTIKITKAGKVFFVKLERAVVSNKPGLVIKVFSDTENSPCVSRHFLDFSQHPPGEIEANRTKIANAFNKTIAKKWVEGYLKLSGL